MFLRRTYLESRFSLPDAGERTTDIAMREPITNLWLEFRATNGEQGNLANILADCVDAIEVIDGSDVIYSMDAEQALAYSAYYCNTLPNQIISEIPTVIQNLSIVIPFGRFEGDARFAFDPTKFLNPQVRIKWNLAAIRAVGADAYVTGSLVYTLVATCMEGGETPEAYFMTKEIYSYVPAVGVEYVDLPTDYPYKMLLVRPTCAAKSIYGLVNNIMLHVNQQQFVLFNMRMTDFIRYNTTMEPILHYDHEFYVADGVNIAFILKYNDAPTFQCQNVDDTVYHYNNTYIGEGALAIDAAGAPAGACNTMAQVTGNCPFGVVVHNFGRRNEPGDYFDAPSFRSVRLELTGAHAGGMCYVSLVQIRPY